MWRVLEFPFRGDLNRMCCVGSNVDHWDGIHGDGAGPRGAFLSRPGPRGGENVVVDEAMVEGSLGCLARVTDVSRYVLGGGNAVYLHRLALFSTCAYPLNLSSVPKNNHITFGLTFRIPPGLG